MSDITLHDDKGQELVVYPEEMVEAVKNTVAVGATNEELYMFLSVAKKYDLDPFLKEVWFVKNPKLGNVIMTGRDAYVKVAQRNPKYVKLQSNPVYENDEFIMDWEDGELKSFIHRHGAKDRGKILGAWATLKYTDKSVSVYVPYQEYSKDANIWTKHKGAMIKKVAEKEVCRLVEGISGIYIPEEMPKGYDLETSQTMQRKRFEKQAEKQETEIVDAEIIETTSNEIVEVDTKPYVEPDFVTANEINELPDEYDPVIFNYAKTMKSKVEESGKPVTKSSMKFQVLKCIKANEIPEELKQPLLKFIHQHCPEDLE